MAKKQLIKLTEGDLHKIIKESVNKVLKENLYGMNRLQGEELYDRIDEYLSKIGDAKVCRFYCTNSIINIAMNQTLGREGKNKIFNIMENLGYKCVNAGGNGEYIMYDFKFDLQENTKKMTNEDYKPLGASYSDEHISYVKTELFIQISDLLKFMNAYSDSILSTNMLDENTYNILYDLLAKIHDRNLIQRHTVK
jgi:hypothetical protein